MTSEIVIRTSVVDQRELAQLLVGLDESTGAIRVETGSARMLDNLDSAITVVLSAASVEIVKALVRHLFSKWSTKKRPKPTLTIRTKARRIKVSSLEGMPDSDVLEDEQILEIHLE